MNSVFAPKRIVVTGLGVVSPLGCGVEPVWSRLIAGYSGIEQLTDPVFADVESRIAAKVPSKSEGDHGFNPDGLIPLKDQRKMDSFIQFGIEAARQAVEQAKWIPTTEAERRRTAVIVGSSIGGFPSIARSVRQFDNEGAKRISPFLIPSFLINLVAGHIAIRHGFKGAMGSPVTACAAGTQAIGDGMRLLLTGEADVAVCGGAEACIDPVIMAGFAASKAISTGYNDQPKEACRPFDISRDGLVLGEGAAVVVLETLDHALRRGAVPIAELVGYGTSTDAHHITACLESGEGLERSMRDAIQMAEVQTGDIGYLNAHGSSTQWGDKSELNAIRSVFDIRSNLSISSTKSSTGHLLGAAGALEAVFTILALREGKMPPTLNFDHPDIACDGLDIIGQGTRFKDLTYALSNSAGFGGVNASLLFKRII